MLIYGLLIGIGPHLRHECRPMYMLSQLRFIRRQTACIYTLEFVQRVLGICTGAKRLLERRMAFPTSSMTLAWRQMRVSASTWLQPSTPMVSYITTPSSTQKCRHSPRWPTYTWRSCTICAYACSFHSFSRNV